MKETIPVRLWDFLEYEGFIENGVMRRYNDEDRHYSDYVSAFFTALVDSGEIKTFVFSDEEVYSDICNTFGAVCCAWYNGAIMDMVILNTEE